MRPKVGYNVMTEKCRDKMLSIAGIAEILEISSEAARMLVHRGTLPHVRQGGRNWVAESAVLRLRDDEEWRKTHSRRPDRGSR